MPEEKKELVTSLGGGTRSTVLLLLTRGEFKVLGAITLLSIYGAAIVAIPLVLGSLFQLSTTFLALPQRAAFSILLLSIYDSTIKDYILVEFSLFVGFVVAAAVSGMSVGRRMAFVGKTLATLGVGSGERKRSFTLVILFISLICTGLSFAFSLVFSSVAVYSISSLLQESYISPIIGETFGFYLAIILVITFIALTLGRSRTDVRSQLPE